MTRFATLLLAICLAPQLAHAQAKPKGKTMGCFTKAEQAAERIVREGLRLREGARGCDGPPWSLGTATLWDDIDKRFGSRFAAQTAIRSKAFQREFATDAQNRLEAWNGRVVMHYRNYPLSEDYCAALKDTLQQMQKRGWAVIDRLAGKARDEVEMDYKPCG